MRKGLLKTEVPLKMLNSDKWTSHLAVVALTIAMAIAVAGQIDAWSSDGHQTVGAIADALIAGHRAAQQVKSILGTAQGKQLTLSTVAVWADCVRGVQPGKGFIYDPGPFKERACAIFEDGSGESAMIAYAKRNNSNCQYSGKNEECHKAFHFADIAIQHSDYSPQYLGASDHDVVHAIAACLDVLEGRPAPAPFNIASPKEALMLLTHFVGDLHQPLHVAAEYLDSKGNVIDPEKGTFNAASDTHGGNSIGPESNNLHHQWDETKFLSTNGAAAPSGMVKSARSLKVPTIDLLKSPSTWASDTVLVAQTKAFQGATTGPFSAGSWSLKTTSTYALDSKHTQTDQVTKGGARLAALLEAIWPDGK
jgi:hypothetical protein